MVVMIGIAIYFFIFLLAFYFVSRGYVEMNEEAEELKAKISSFEQKAREVENGPMVSSGEVVALKSALQRMSEDLVLRTREKELLELEFSRLKSDQLDAALKDAQMAVKDKEIRRLTAELRHLTEKVKGSPLIK